MHPILFHIGPVLIPAYGAMAALGVLLLHRPESMNRPAHHFCAFVRAYACANFSLLDIDIICFGSDVRV